MIGLVYFLLPNYRNLFQFQRYYKSSYSVPATNTLSPQQQQSGTSFDQHQHQQQQQQLSPTGSRLFTKKKRPLMATRSNTPPSSPANADKLSVDDATGIISHTHHKQRLTPVEKRVSSASTMAVDESAAMAKTSQTVSMSTAAFTKRFRAAHESFRLRMQQEQNRGFEPVHGTYLNSMLVWENISNSFHTHMIGTVLNVAYIYRCL